MSINVTGYYRSWCNPLAPLFYDALMGVLGLFIGGERRFREKIVAAANLQRNDKALDVACGTGALAILMAQRVGENGEVVGIDISPQMLQAARRKANLPKLTFQQANAEDIPFPDASFDVVTITYALHEMPRSARENALGEIRRVLKPDGRLVVVDLHQPKSGLRRAMFKLLMLLENENAWDLVRNGLRNEIAQAGFQNIQQVFIYPDLIPVVLAIKP